MSGNPLFIGWNGTSPAFVELAPQVQYEPITRPVFVGASSYQLAEYVYEKLTRRLVCFDHAKDSVIASLRYTADITANIVGQNGATTTRSFGGNWQLLTIDDAAYKTGSSVLTVSYRRVVPTAFRFNLPEGLTITCAAGVTSIKFNGHTLEELDNGTGLCGEGLGFKTEQFASGFSGQSTRQTIDAEAENGRLYAKATLFSNGVEFDSIEILGRDVVQRSVVSRQYYVTLQTLSGSGASPIYSAAIAERDAWLAANTLGQPDRDSIITAYQAANPNREFTIFSFRYIESKSGDVLPVFSTDIQPPVVSWEWRQSITQQIFIVERYNLPSSAFSTTANVRWEKTGNILRLLWGDVVWREYDVTGLTP